jgi:hypothetical protein
VTDVPASHTFVDGLATSSEANSYIRDPIQFLLNRPVARVRRTSAQSIADSTPTAITFTTEDYDTANGWDSGVNPSRYTAVYPGKYLANATGRRGCWWRVNGTDINGSQGMIPAGTAAAVSVVARPTHIYLGVGDYVELICYQSSTVSLNTSALTFEMPSMDIEWVSM